MSFFGGLFGGKSDERVQRPPGPSSFGGVGPGSVPKGGSKPPTSGAPRTGTQSAHVPAPSSTAPPSGSGSFASGGGDANMFGNMNVSAGQTSAGVSGASAWGATSGTSSTTAVAPPSAAPGGGDLFGGMMVASGGDAGGGSSGFDFVGGGDTSAAPESGFNFVGEGNAGVSGGDGGESSFAFVAGGDVAESGGGGMPVSGSPEAESSGFSFVGGGGADVIGGMVPSGGEVAQPSVGLGGGGGGGLPVVSSEAEIGDVKVVPAKIRKKRRAKRVVGFGREEDEEGGVLGGGGGAEDDAQGQGGPGGPPPPGSDDYLEAVADRDRDGEKEKDVEVEAAQPEKIKEEEPKGGLLSGMQFKGKPNSGGGGGLLSGMQVRVPVKKEEEPVVERTEDFLPSPSPQEKLQHKRRETEPEVSVVAVEEKPKDESPAGLIRRALEDVDEAARMDRMGVGSVWERYVAVTEKVRTVRLQVAEAEGKVTSLRRDQAAAAAAEDFERAASLDEAISNAETEVKRVSEEERKASQELERLSEDRAASLFNLVEIVERANSTLDSVSKERRLALEELADALESKSASRSDALRTEQEQLEIKEEAIKNESKAISAEETKVATSIDEQTQGLGSDAIRKKEKLEQLTKERIELERLLEAKKLEEEEARNDLKAAEAKVERVRARFAKQQERLVTRRQHIEKEFKECRSEAQALREARRQFRHERLRDQATKASLRRQAATAAFEAKVASNLRDALRSASKLSGELSELERTGDREEARLRSAAAAAKEAKAGAEAAKESAEAAAREAEERLEEIDGQTPALEEEKRAAVKGRKFKEAGRLSSELKRLSQLRESAALEAREASAQVDAAEEEMQRTGRLLREADTTLEEFQREHAKKRSERSLQAAKALRETQKNILAIKFRPGHERQISSPKAAAKAADAEDGGAGADVLGGASSEDEEDATSLQDLRPRPLAGEEVDILLDPSDAPAETVRSRKRRVSRLQAAAALLLDNQIDLIRHEMDHLSKQWGPDLCPPLPPLPIEDEENDDEDDEEVDDEEEQHHHHHHHHDSDADNHHQNLDHTKSPQNTDLKSDSPSPDKPSSSSPTSEDHQDSAEKDDDDQDRESSGDAPHEEDSGHQSPTQQDYSDLLPESLQGDKTDDAATELASLQKSCIASVDALELAIAAAAQVDDFDLAAQCESVAEPFRSKLEALNAKALEWDMDPIEVPEPRDPDDASVQLSGAISTLEQRVEDAVSSDDFDLADKFQAVIDALREHAPAKDDSEEEQDAEEEALDGNDDDESPEKQDVEDENDDDESPEKQDVEDENDNDEGDEEEEETPQKVEEEQEETPQNVEEEQGGEELGFGFLEGDANDAKEKDGEEENDGDLGFQFVGDTSADAAGPEVDDSGFVADIPPSEEKLPSVEPTAQDDDDDDDDGEIVE